MCVALFLSPDFCSSSVEVLLQFLFRSGFFGRLATGQEERWSFGFVFQVSLYSSKSKMVEVQGDGALRNLWSLKMRSSELIFQFIYFS